MKKLYLFIIFILCGMRLTFAQLPAPTTRVWAQTQTNSRTPLLASISDANNAVSQDNPQYTYSTAAQQSSTLSILVSLLNSIGYAQQTLSFNDDVPLGTPVHVKIGLNIAVLTVGQIIQLTAIDKNGNTLETQTAGNLLSALSGSNQTEIVFNNDDANKRNIKSIQIYFSSTVGVLPSMNVYGAYYETAGGSNTDNATDVLSGTETTDLANAASALSAVLNPYAAIDSNQETYATMYATANVAAQQQLTATFPGYSTAGSYVHLLIEDPNKILSLSLLKGATEIQLLLNGTTVETYNADNWALLKLELLGLGNDGIGWITIKSEHNFDAVKVISNSGVASILPTFRVYEINRNARSLVLPVDYSNPLKATNKIGSNILEWSTAQEQNNKGFNIMRSPNSKDWENIGFVGSKITNGTGTDYSFTDNSPLSGTNYYQLKQIDLDGKTTNSNIVSVSNLSAQSQISIYPNPAKDQLHIKNITANTKYKIVNIAGQTVKTGIIYNNPASITISDLAAGMYILQTINNIDQTMNSFKFIKK